MFKRKKYTRKHRLAKQFRRLSINLSLEQELIKDNKSYFPRLGLNNGNLENINTFFWSDINYHGTSEISNTKIGAYWVYNTHFKVDTHLEFFFMEHEVFIDNEKTYVIYPFNYDDSTITLSGVENMSESEETVHMEENYEDCTYESYTRHMGLYARLLNKSYSSETQSNGYHDFSNFNLFSEIRARQNTVLFDTVNVPINFYRDYINECKTFRERSNIY